MKVYTCRFSGGYCGGLVVVAANSEDEAYKVVKNDEELELLFDNVDKNGNYTENRDDWQESSYCYHRKDFRLLKGVTANVKRPKILVEDHYQE